VGRDGRRYTTDLGQAKSDISEIPNQVSAVSATGACLNPRSAVKYAYGKDGTPILIKEPKLMLNDNDAGKPEGIHLMIGRRPNASFGNSTGDQQMSEYTGAGGGARLAMLVLHDDATREYAYGPAQGLLDTKVGTFTQALHDEAKKKNWTVISMKNDWKKIFSFE